MDDSASMAWATGLSERVDALEALSEASARAREQLGGVPDLAMVFVSSLHARRYAELALAMPKAVGTEAVIGCSAAGVVGGGRELERREAVSVVLARLPQAASNVFKLDHVPSDEAGWRALTGLDPSPQQRGTLLLVVDPASIDAQGFVGHLDQLYPSVIKLGGVLSGVTRSGAGALFHRGGCLRHGAVGLALGSEIEVVPVIAQGCRPIGEPMIITRSREAVIEELNVGKPVEVLQRVLRNLPPRDQELGRHSLYVGIEMRGSAHRYAQGDFLIREVRGLDPQSGAMAIGGRCEDYQVVQFHLRDAQTSAQDLQRRLHRAQRALGEAPPAFALMFAAVERGHALYGTSDHDSNAICRALGAVPIGGMFAAGELGPVGARTFVHGHTSAIALFPAAQGKSDR